jgi:uncharacterized protein YndB with AHSA1/START domain
MTDEKKPARVLELDVAIDATPEEVWKAITEAARVANWFAPEVTGEGSGMGSTLTASWGGGVEFTTTIGAWEPNRHVRWVNDDLFGPGLSLVADWHISTEAGKTRLRLVQSGFGEFEGWDGFFEGTDTGWRYFLHNLRVYVEKHAGKTRRMISSRFPAGIGRADAWKKLPPARLGETVTFDLGQPVPATVDLVVPERALALRIPSLDDALLFIELEGSGEKFSIGTWLSVYDPAAASRIEPGARQAFARLAEAVK